MMICDSCESERLKDGASNTYELRLGSTRRWDVCGECFKQIVQAVEKVMQRRKKEEAGD